MSNQVKVRALTALGGAVVLMLIDFASEPRGFTSGRLTTDIFIGPSAGLIVPQFWRASQHDNPDQRSGRWPPSVR